MSMKYEGASKLEKIEQIEELFKSFLPYVMSAYQVEAQLTDKKNYYGSLDEIEANSLKEASFVVTSGVYLMDTMKETFQQMEELSFKIDEQYQGFHQQYEETKVTPEELIGLTGIPEDHEQEVTSPNEFESIFDTDDEPEL